MPQQNNSCPAIAQSLDLPAIRQISQRYGSHWQSLNRLTKWALCGIWGFEAAAYASENLGKGQYPIDPTEDLEPILSGLMLTNQEVGDVRYIIGELAEIDESQQAALVSALAATIAAGIYAEQFSDLFMEA